MTGVRSAAYRRRMKSLAVIGVAARRSRRRRRRRRRRVRRPPPQHSIVVTGNGSVATVPDRAQLSFGVSTDAKTASAALRANAAEMTKVIAAIKAQGIAAADIRTELVSLSPRYSQNGETVVGYTATNSVSATLRNLDKVGAGDRRRSRRGREPGLRPEPRPLRRRPRSTGRRCARRSRTPAGKAQTIAKASGLPCAGSRTSPRAAAPPLPLADAKTAHAAPATPIEPGTAARAGDA